MGNDAAERRAKKAERRAENIRKHARSSDSGAENRAKRAERRADNIREYAREQARSGSGSNAQQRSKRAKPSNDDGMATFVAGCIAVVVVIAGVMWVVEKVRDWFSNLF
jgi:Flp pilus assembly protein TadB